MEFDAFNLIKLKDRVVTGSSIMPQKNPDTLEYLREKLEIFMKLIFDAYNS